MPVIEKILRFLDTQWETPALYGTYHIICLVLMFAVAILLCVLWTKGIIKNARNVVLVTAIVVLVFEIYKQINYTFGVGDAGITVDYRWYAFPWQFCSTPLYIGLLAGLTKGKPHDHFCSYLSTYALFAGLAVMLYPGDVFTSTIGICIQTVICHGSMVVIAIFLFYTEHVSTDWSTLWKATPIFGIALSVAVGLNELSHVVGIDTEGFNMFFVSRWNDSTLPVYSLVHNAIMKSNPNLYPLCVILYMVGFTCVAAFMLLLARGIKLIATTDYNAEYAEMDARRQERIVRRKEKLELLEERRKQALKEEREKRLRKRADKKAKKLAERKEKQAERREKRKEKQAERREERKEMREERRDERQRELEIRKKERKKAQKEKRKEMRDEKKERRKKKKERKRQLRRDEKKLRDRMNENEKREKKLEKERKKQAKEEKKAAKEAKKALKEQRKAEKKAAKRAEKRYNEALKHWIKKQKKAGKHYSIEDFDEYYYR